MPSRYSDFCVRGHDYRVPGNLHVYKNKGTYRCNVCHRMQMAAFKRGQGLDPVQRTHCAKGHPYSGDNLKISIKKDGTKKRTCMTCLRISRASYAIKRKYPRNVEKNKVSNKKWREKNKAYNSYRKKIWLSTNIGKEKADKARKEWYARTKDYRNEHDRSYRQNLGRGYVRQVLKAKGFSTVSDQLVDFEIERLRLVRLIKKNKKK